jgi:hypothetical protein
VASRIGFVGRNQHSIIASNKYKVLPSHNGFKLWLRIYVYPDKAAAVPCYKWGHIEKFTKGKCTGRGRGELILHYSLRCDLNSLMGIGAVLRLIYCERKFWQMIA